MSQIFSVPKSGNQDDENEDRYSNPCPTRRGGVWASLALSDGATEASFSREWADTIVGSSWRSLIDAPRRRNATVVDPTAVGTWLAEIRDAFAPMTEGRALTWYAKAKMSRQGAFATLLGLHLTHGYGRRKWAAIACGDTCMFHVVDGVLASSFPITDANEFGSRPSLVPSNALAPMPIFQLQVDQQWQKGDAFVLATDAIALWLMSEDEMPTRFSDLLVCKDQASFADLVSREREAGRMKNDDTTVIVLRT